MSAGGEPPPVEPPKSFEGDEAADRLPDGEPRDGSKALDYRKASEFKTRYPCRAWISISVEAVYLAMILLVLLTHFIFSMTPLAATSDNAYGWFMATVAGPTDGKRFQYLLIALAGALGGSLFSVKWLVHSVAKGFWNEDRRLWRFFVPLTAAVTSVIFAAIIQSGLISLFDTNSFRNLEVAFAFGGLVGYYSDGVVGVMSNIAGALFGTVKERRNK